VDKTNVFSGSKHMVLGERWAMMQRIFHRFALPILIYTLFSLLDVCLTHLYVVVLGVYAEANPRNVFVGNPCAWFLADLGIVLFATWVFGVVSSSSGNPNVVRLAVCCAYALAMLRSLPVVHNLMLMAGIETPLPRLLYS